LKALDLVEDAYIGYVPTNVTKWALALEWRAECTSKLVHEDRTQFAFFYTHFWETLRVLPYFLVSVSVCFVFPTVDITQFSKRNISVPFPVYGKMGMVLHLLLGIIRILIWMA
jgi:hypothetical protein